MLRPYRELFTVPGALSFSLAGFFARITMSTVGLGIVLLLSGQHGRYSLAGAVAGTYSLVAAFVGPRIGGLADRRGQSPVLVCCAALLTAGLVALVVCTIERAPGWTLFASAAIAGSGNAAVGAMIRARWATIHTGTARLHTAYSLESVIDEMVFIAGPILVTLLVTEVNQVAGLLTVLAIAVVGLVSLAAQRRTQPAPSAAPPSRRGTVVRLPAIQVLVLVMVGLGVLFGSTEVVTVAFVSQAGQRPITGLVLASWALGSAIAGLGYGSIHFRASLTRRFLIGVTAMWLATFLLLLPAAVPALAAVLFVSGFTIAPTLVTGVSLVEAVVPSARLTEGMTWVGTAITLGATAGTVLAGRAVDVLGPHLAFSVTVAAGTVAALTAYAGTRWLVPSSERVQLHS
jgi:MFS family permease